MCFHSLVIAWLPSLNENDWASLPLSFRFVKGDYSTTPSLHTTFQQWEDFYTAQGRKDHLCQGRETEVQRTIYSHGMRGRENTTYKKCGSKDDAEAEAPILQPPDGKNWLIGKDADAGKDWRQEEKGTTEDEMVGWHHRLDGHEFEQAPGAGDGRGNLVCCSSWHCKQSETTEQLNWTKGWRMYLICTGLEYQVPGTCGVLYILHILSHSTWQPQRSPTIIMSILQVRKEIPRKWAMEQRFESRYSKIENPHSTVGGWSGGGGKPELKLNPFRAIHGSLAQWWDENIEQKAHPWEGSTPTRTPLLVRQSGPGCWGKLAVQQTQRFPGEGSGPMTTFSNTMGTHPNVYSDCLWMLGIWMSPFVLS